MVIRSTAKVIKDAEKQGHKKALPGKVIKCNAKVIKGTDNKDTINVIKDTAILIMISSG